MASRNAPSPTPSQADLDAAKVIVVMFTIDGCGACAEYKPRFKKLATRYQNYVPVLMADANDPQWANLAQRLNVQNVPATFALRRPTGLIRIEGSIPDAQIVWLLDAAAREAAAQP